VNAWVRDVFDKNLASKIEKSTVEASEARESAWLFSNLKICLKSQLENLAFQMMTIFKYTTI